MPEIANDATAIQQAFNLLPHQEGGYYRRTYTSQITDGAERVAATAIYYLLTTTEPIGHWHKNRSDIIHCFHIGSPLTYWLIDPQGRLSQCQLGTDWTQGQQLQLQVPGGYWKATELEQGDYALISEVVVPGFDDRDMVFAKGQDLKPSLSPADWDQMKHLIK
ncbi:MAG: cupin domain-containing protein [Pseudomonadota bacterium]